MSSLEETTEQIKHILSEFQLGDLHKSMSGPNKLNFLAAIGLMVATEFLGGLITGTLGNKNYSSRNRFEVGFKYLGPAYETLLKQNKKSVTDIYDNIRCGIVHQYLPSCTAGIYGGETNSPGIVKISDQFQIIPENYIRDIQFAVYRLLREIESDTDLLQNCQRGLAGIPRLA